MDRTVPAVMSIRCNGIDGFFLQKDFGKPTFQNVSGIQQRIRIDLKQGSGLIAEANRRFRRQQKRQIALCMGQNWKVTGFRQLIHSISGSLPGHIAPQFQKDIVRITQSGYSSLPQCQRRLVGPGNFRTGSNLNIQIRPAAELLAGRLPQ